MKFNPFVSSVFAVASLALVACSADAPAASSDSNIVMGDHAEALLTQAVAQAERHAQGNVCDDVYRSTIIDTLRQAVAENPSAAFRARIAGKQILAQEVGDTVEWQQILGVFDPAHMETLKAAFEKGVSLWDTSGGAYGNKEQLELKANGKAVLHTLDVDTQEPTWHTSELSWSLTNGTLTLGTGESYELTWENDMLYVKAAEGGIVYISQQSECEA